MVDFKNDIDILARTLLGECEPWNEDEAKAIASVIMNRVRFKNWPNTPAAVCLQPWQFSCWNANDPNRGRIIAAAGRWFEKCLDIATLAVKHGIHDPTCGATHYYLSSIKTPKWAKGKTSCYRTLHKNGSFHLFFNDIDTPPPTSCPVAVLDQQRPLTETRTAKGAALAGAGTAAGLLADVTDAKDSLAPIAAYSAHIQTALLILTLIGIGVMLWARWDDRRKGLR